MIGRKVVDFFAHQCGARDQLVAEREVVLTYALHLLSERGVLDRLAFKGGTALRKLVFGAGGRFSEDLDFTLRAGEVPGIHTFPESCHLSDPGAATLANE